MKNLKKLIQEFENNKIKKVSILISEMFSGGYQLKDGYQKSEDVHIIDWVNHDNFNEFDMHFGSNYNENKPFFGPSFYMVVEQELDVNWFIDKLKEYIEEEHDTLDYFIDFLVNEHDIHLTSEVGLIGDVVELGRSETFILTDGEIGLNGDIKKFESDIDFAVSFEARELDYLFFINEKPLIFSDMDKNISSSSNNETGYRIIKNYFDNEELKEEFETLDGKRHGYYKLYHDNGQLKVIVNFENGIQVDEVIDSFDLNGKLIRKTEIKNGLLNGPFKEYYSSGIIKKEGNYKDGVISGTVIEYCEDGSIKVENINNNIVKNVETNSEFIREIDSFTANHKIDRFDLEFFISKWYGHTPFIYSGEFEGYKFNSEISEVHKWGDCEHSYIDLNKLKFDLKNYEIEELHKHLDIDIISDDGNFEIEFIKWDENTPQEFIEEKEEEWGAFDIMNNSTEEEQFEIVYKEGAVINEIKLILTSADEALELHWKYSIENEKYDKVISALKYASDNNKDQLNEAINKIISAHNYNDKSYDYYDNGKYQEGINSVKKALDVIPDNSGFLDTLALGYFHIGDYDKALEIINNCIDIDENKKNQNPEHFTNRAKIYIKLNKEEHAIKDLKTALELDPNYGEAEELLNSLIK